MPTTETVHASVTIEPFDPAHGQVPFACPVVLAEEPDERDVRLGKDAASAVRAAAYALKSLRKTANRANLARYSTCLDTLSLPVWPTTRDGAQVRRAGKSGKTETRSPAGWSAFFQGESPTLGDILSNL